MSKAEIETYLTSLQKSGLVTKEQLASVLSQAVKAVGEPRLTPEILADYYEKAGHVTPWHNEKLLKGKYKGFFLGNYRLLGHIATGGMSNIYLAEHVAMRRRVAVKVLPPTLTNNSSHLNRFYIESRVIASLDHPNIVRAYDVSQQGNFHYLVMEYVEGTDMRRLVQDDGVLPFELAADYLRQACDGLYHAHLKGLVHRDVKPANLLVDRTGVVKVLDMGLTRITDSGDPSLTLAHNEKLIGTVDYIAPEQAQNSHDVDARADIYSLGCTLYYLLVGQPPFNDGTQTHRLLCHATKEPPPVRQFRTDLPVDLEHIIRKMMMKRRDHRYQSAGEVSRELAHWLAARGAGAPPQGSSVGLPSTAQHLPSLPPPSSANTANQPPSLAGMMNAPASTSGLPPTGAGPLTQAGGGMGPVSAMMMAPPVGARSEGGSSAVAAAPGTSEVPSSLDSTGYHHQHADGEQHSVPGSGNSTLKLQQTLASRMEQLSIKEAQIEQSQSELESRLKHLEESEVRAQKQLEEVRRAKEQLVQLETFLEEKSGLLERQAEGLQESQRQLQYRETQVVEWVNKVRSQIGADLAAQGHTGFDADVVQRLQQLDDFLERKAQLLETQSEQVLAKIRELEARESRVSDREAVCDVRHAMIMREQQALRNAEPPPPAPPLTPEEEKARQTLESLENFLEQKASWVESETAHVQEEKSKLEKQAFEIRDQEESLSAKLAALDAREAHYADYEARESLLSQREAAVVEREAAITTLEAALLERDLNLAAKEREIGELRASAERARAEAALVQAQSQATRADLLKRQEQLSKQADEFTAKARSVQKTLADLDRLKQDIKRREHELAVREGRAPAVLNAPSSVDMTQAAAMAASVAAAAASAAAASASTGGAVAATVAPPAETVVHAASAPEAASAAPAPAESAGGALPNSQ